MVFGVTGRVGHFFSRAKFLFVLAGARGRLEELAIFLAELIFRCDSNLMLL